MTLSSMMHLTSAEVAALDPYAFLAVLGKRVIHPGGVAHLRSYSAVRTFSRTNRSWMSAAGLARLPLRSPAGSGQR